MILVLLILIPFISGALSFLWKGRSVKVLAMVSALFSLAVALMACKAFMNGALYFDMPWIRSLGARFSLDADGMAVVLVLLTALVYPLIFLSQWGRPTESLSRFTGLMLLSQAGITGVFLAEDMLLFYFFWELALIPVYFLASGWGGEKRIPVTFKFFIYTFLGSLMMLAGLIYLYLNTPDRSFDYDAIVAAGQSLDLLRQQVLFWFLFAAFAVKMPVFPFHTWQPDAYVQSAIPVTIVLSAVMAKMGLFAAVKWLLPVVPQAVDHWSNFVMILAVTGILYASVLALVQSDLKRLAAYSSIAHIGLMALGIFAQNEIATNGLIFQMFNHGVNITGIWIIIGMIEERYGTRNMRELGGMAGVAPVLTVALVILAFANIALPLTNSFVGEFMLFHGIFESNNPNHITFMVLAGTAIILGAAYTLNMVQKVAYGQDKKDLRIADARVNETIGLGAIILIVLLLGVYPNLLLGLFS